MNTNGNKAMTHPAKAGNQNAAKYGLYSRSKNVLKLRSRRVRRLVRKAQEVMSWIRPEQVPVLRSWAELEVVGAAMFAMLETAGVVGDEADKNGDLIPRRLLGEYARIKQLQLQYAKELGMTPGAYAALRIDALQGDDLASRAAQLRRQGDGRA